MNKTITIGFSRPTNRLFPIGSWLIRLYENTPYSHVYLKFHSETLNRTIIYESAAGRGVSFIGNALWEEHAKEVMSFDLPIKPCNQTYLLQHCVDHAGIEYGWMQNLGVVIARLFKLDKNPFSKGKNCSEAIAEVLKHEGYEIGKDTNLVTPKDIYRVLSGHKHG